MSEIATREFELSALSFFLQKPLFYAQKRKDLKDIQFTSKKINRVMAQLDHSFVNYKEFPTKHELLERMKHSLTDKGDLIDIEWDEYEDIINEAYSKQVTANTGEQINLYLIDEARKRLGRQLLECPLDKVDEVSREVEGKIKHLRKSVYTSHDFGMNFFSRAGREQLKEDMHNYNHGACIPTGFTWLDEALRGGSRKGELACIIGTTGIGKTTMMINMARRFLDGGARVLHIYLDSTKEETAIRVGSSFLGEEIAHDADLDDVIDRIFESYPGYENRYFLKQYPAKAIDVDDLDQFMEDFHNMLYQIDKENGVYEEDCGLWDVTILDYLEMIDYNGPEDSFMVDEAKAQKLNALCVKYNMATWTGSQGGTEAMKTDKPKLHMAHGYKNRFHPMANILMLCCPEEERQLLLRHFTADFAKSRRPVVYPSIPFVMDILCQRIYEDEDRCPKIGPTKQGAPDQTKAQQGGVAQGATADDTAGAWT